MKIGYLSAFVSLTTLEPVRLFSWTAMRRATRAPHQDQAVASSPKQINHEQREADALPAKRSFRTRAIDMARRLWNAPSAYQARRETASMLHSLDNRALADIGLNRGQIDLALFGRVRPLPLCLRATGIVSTVCR